MIYDTAKRLTAFCAALCLAMMLLPQLAMAEGYAAETETTCYATVATEKGTLNMRAEPKDGAKVLKKLAKGSIVRIVEMDGDWTSILYGETAGYVMTSFLEEISELPYSPIMRDDKGDAVLAFKKGLHKLGYIKSEEINSRFDADMETCLAKLQLMSGVDLNPGLVTPEVQALMEWGMLAKAKSGYLGTETDDESGLTISIFCWDSDGTLYEKDQAVKLKISFAAAATGGVPPYDITVTKSIDGSGAQFGDVVTSPFSHIWGQTSERVYVYATATDAEGNTVTACAPFKYSLPDRYVND